MAACAGPRRRSPGDWHYKGTNGESGPFGPNRGTTPYDPRMSQQPLPINARVTIPAAELDVSFVRSGGPGGQNVNKTSTQAQLRWNVRTSAALSPSERDRLLAALESRLTGEGELILQSQQTRSQSANLDAARSRLKALVAGALTVPKTRRPTRPTRGSQRRRIEAKKRRSETKRRRQKPPE